VGNLEHRAQRLEEQAEWRATCERLETERVFKEALSRVSTPELRAMHEHFKSSDREEWAQEDEPLMRRLLELMEEVRSEEQGEFAWLSEVEPEE
jgi:hypothetical protein